MVKALVVLAALAVLLLFGCTKTTIVTVTPAPTVTEEPEQTSAFGSELESLFVDACMTESVGRLTCTCMWEGMIVEFTLTEMTEIDWDNAPRNVQRRLDDVALGCLP